MIRPEGVHPIISETLYSSLFQVVLLFGSETWVQTAAMMKKFVVLHVRFLRKVTGKKL